MSQITTHVLDTSKGRPAEGIQITLQSFSEDERWANVASGITNSDGRISDLLSDQEHLIPGIYRMLFQTGSYFENQSLPTFYPVIPVVFEISDTDHYHIPLLLNPFGYSTYRGS